MVQNIGMLESAVMLTVDRNVCIHGIILASQVYGRNEDGTCDLTSTGDYTELLHFDLQGIDGNRLADSHFSGQSPRRSTIDVLFISPSTCSAIANIASKLSLTVAATTRFWNLRLRSCRKEFNSSLVTVPEADLIAVFRMLAMIPFQWMMGHISRLISKMVSSAASSS